MGRKHKALVICSLPLSRSMLRVCSSEFGDGIWFNGSDSRILYRRGAAFSRYHRHLRVSQKGTWCHGCEFTVHKLKYLVYEMPELSVLEPIWLTRCHPLCLRAKDLLSVSSALQCSHTTISLQSCMTWLGWGS